MSCARNKNYHMEASHLSSRRTKYDKLAYDIALGIFIHSYQVSLFFALFPVEENSTLWMMMLLYHPIRVK